MQVVIAGLGKTNLDDSDFMAEGGEGKIYRKGNTIYKVYFDPNNMIPQNKIIELQNIARNNVIVPKDIILDKNGNKRIGFTMPCITDPVSLCKLFSNAFRAKEGITNDKIIKLFENMIDTTKHVHKAGCLIVDANEFNFLVSPVEKYTMPYFIDTNAWKTPSYSPAAIMISVKDWSAGNNFTELSDWYSLAITTFQLFIGIHPFRGNHPDYTKEKYGDDLLKHRMVDNVSVFDPKVTVPGTTRDFSVIPQNYLDWYKQVFSGKRLPPPMSAGMIIVVPIKISSISGSNNFDIDLIKTYDSNIVFVRFFDGMQVTKTEKRIYVQSLAFQGNKDGYLCNPGVDAIFSNETQTPILIRQDVDDVKFKNLRSGEMLNSIAGEKFMVVENTVYIKLSGKLFEVRVEDFLGKSLTVLKNTWGIMAQSSQFLDGVIYQNLLGKAYLTIPDPKNETMHNIYIPQLDGYKIVDGKYQNRICVVYGHKSGKYTRFIIRFDVNHVIDEVTTIDDVDIEPINMVTLPNGITAVINSSNEVHLMSKGKLLKIQDPAISSEMTLCNDGNQTMIYKEDKLYTLKTRKKS